MATENVTAEALLERKRFVIDAGAQIEAIAKALNVAELEHHDNLDSLVTAMSVRISQLAAAVIFMMAETAPEAMLEHKAVIYG